MNTKFIASTLIAVAALASSAAFARDEPGSRATPIVSTFSRGEVQAEYFKAVKDGTMAANNEAGDVTAQAFNSVATRTEVKEQAVLWAHVKNKPVGELM